MPSQIGRVIRKTNSKLSRAFVKREYLRIQNKKARLFNYFMLLLTKVLIPQASCWNHHIARNVLRIFEPCGAKGWTIHIIPY